MNSPLLRILAPPLIVIAVITPAMAVAAARGSAHGVLIAAAIGTLTVAYVVRRKLRPGPADPDQPR